MFARRSILAILTGVATLLAVRPARAGDSLFVLRNVSGPWPAAGASYVLRPPEATLSIKELYYNRLSLRAVSGTKSWSIEVSAGRRNRLSAGVYGPALSPSSFADTLPSLEAGCSAPLSWFDVRQLSFDAAGKVRRLRLVFEMTCTGTPSIVVGEFRWDADTTVMVAAPIHVRARRGQELEFDVSVANAGGPALGLTALELPGGATFTDRGDGSARFAWTPPIDRPGDHRVTFLAGDAFGHADTAHTLIRVDGDTLIDVVSEPGDPAWLGQGCRLRPGDMRVATSYAPTSSGGFGVTVFPFDLQQAVRSFLIQTAVGRIRPGNFSVLRRWSDDTYADGRLTATPAPGSCGAKETSVRIRTLLPGHVDSLRSLWVEWEQHCNGALPAFRGEIRVNAGSPVVIYAPIARRVHHGDTLAFSVTARDTLGRPLTISSTGLPVGASLTPATGTRSEFRWVPPVTAAGGHRVAFAAVNDLLQADTVVTDIVVTGDVSAWFTSEPGDPAGKGLAEAWPGTAGHMLETAVTTDFFEGAVVNAILYGPNAGWHVSLHGVDGVLAPLGLTSVPWPRPYPGPPYFDAYWANYAGYAGRGEWNAADFRIRRFARSPSGQPTRLWLEFEQSSEDRVGILRGEIRLDVTWRVMVRAPLRRSGTWSAPVEFEIVGETPEGEAPALSVLQPPPQSWFLATGPGRAAFGWTPQQNDVQAPRLVGFIATRSSGEADTAWTTLEALPEGVLHLEEGGRTWDLTGELGRFRTHGDVGWADVTFASPTSDTLWRVTFRAAYGDTLRPGVGIMTGWGPHYSPTICIDTPGDFWASCEDDTGRFEIESLFRVADGSPSTLRATFDHGSSERRFFGSLRVGPPAALDVPIVPVRRPQTFECRGLVPNPVSGASRLRLALPRAGDVHIQVIDVGGRRAIAHSWSGLAAGGHSLDVPGLGALPPGLYLVRVTWDAEQVVSRAVLLD